MNYLIPVFAIGVGTFVFGWHHSHLIAPAVGGIFMGFSIGMYLAEELYND